MHGNTFREDVVAGEVILHLGLCQRQGMCLLELSTGERRRLCSLIVQVVLMLFNPRKRLK